MSLKNRITQAVAAKKSAENIDLIEEKRALQTPMISAEEQEWALRLHQKAGKDHGSFPDQQHGGKRGTNTDS